MQHAKRNNIRFEGRENVHCMLDQGFATRCVPMFFVRLTYDFDVTVLTCMRLILT